MSTIDETLAYDENDSVAFIRNFLPQELKEKFSEDDILYIVDLIYEYYESVGVLDETSQSAEDAEVEIDEEALLQFVVKNANRDGVGHFLPEEVQFIVQGELGYCESINMFD